MKLVRQYCAPQGALFFPVLISLVACLFSLKSSAHTVVLSEYSLEYRNGRWELEFDQKTSQLRDAIYATRPDLKGINLNSEAFREATAAHIISNLTMKYRGEVLQIVPKHMHYGGLRFESRFLVEGLPEEPDYLTMRVDGFDTHEHSIVLFRVTEATEGYLNYFNQEQRLATFDFLAKNYVFEEVSGNGRYTFILYALLFLIITGITVKLVKNRMSSIPN